MRVVKKKGLLLILIIPILFQSTYAQNFDGALDNSDPMSNGGSPYDKHTVTAREMQRIYARMTSYDFVPYFVARGPFGSVFESQPGTAPTYVEQTFYAPSSGIWEFYALSRDSSARGSYTLEVILGPVPITEQIEGVLDSNDPHSIKGELFEQHSRSWLISKPFNVNVRASFCAFLLVIAPSSREYRAADPCTNNLPGERFSLPEIAPENGVWQLFLTSREPGQTGNYAITVNLPRPEVSDP